MSSTKSHSKRDKETSTEDTGTPKLLDVIYDWRGTESQSSAKELLDLIRSDLPKWPPEVVKKVLAVFEGRLSGPWKCLPNPDDSYIEADLDSDWPPSPTPLEMQIDFCEELISTLKQEIALSSEMDNSAFPPTVPPNTQPNVGKRRLIARQNPRMSASNLCRRFDLESIPLPGVCPCAQQQVADLVCDYEATPIIT